MIRFKILRLDEAAAHLFGHVKSKVQAWVNGGETEFNRAWKEADCDVSVRAFTHQDYTLVKISMASTKKVLTWPVVMSFTGEDMVFFGLSVSAIELFDNTKETDKKGDPIVAVADTAIANSCKTTLTYFGGGAHEDSINSGGQFLYREFIRWAFDNKHFDILVSAFYRIHGFPRVGTQDLEYCFDAKELAQDWLHRRPRGNVTPVYFYEDEKKEIIAICRFPDSNYLGSNNLAGPGTESSRPRYTESYTGFTTRHVNPVGYVYKAPDTNFEVSENEYVPWLLVRIPFFAKDDTVSGNLVGGVLTTTKNNPTYSPIIFGKKYDLPLPNLRAVLNGKTGVVKNPGIDPDKGVVDENFEYVVNYDGAENINIAENGEITLLVAVRVNMYRAGFEVPADNGNTRIQSNEYSGRPFSAGELIDLRALLNPAEPWYVFSPPSYRSNAYTRLMDDGNTYRLDYNNGHEGIHYSSVINTNKWGGVFGDFTQLLIGVDETYNASVVQITKRVPFKLDSKFTFLSLEPGVDEVVCGSFTASRAPRLDIPGQPIVSYLDYNENIECATYDMNGIRRVYGTANISYTSGLNDANTEYSATEKIDAEFFGVDFPEQTYVFRNPFQPGEPEYVWSGTTWMPYDIYGSFDLGILVKTGYRTVVDGNTTITTGGSGVWYKGAKVLDAPVVDAVRHAPWYMHYYADYSYSALQSDWNWSQPFSWSERNTHPNVFSMFASNFPFFGGILLGTTLYKKAFPFLQSKHTATEFVSAIYPFGPLATKNFGVRCSPFPTIDMPIDVSGARLGILFWRNAKPGKNGIVLTVEYNWVLKRALASLYYIPRGPAFLKKALQDLINNKDIHYPDTEMPIERAQKVNDFIQMVFGLPPEPTRQQMDALRVAHLAAVDACYKVLVNNFADAKLIRMFGGNNAQIVAPWGPPKTTI